MSSLSLHSTPAPKPHPGKQFPQIPPVFVLIVLVALTVTICAVIVGISQTEHRTEATFPADAAKVSGSTNGAKNVTVATSLPHASTTPRKAKSTKWMPSGTLRHSTARRPTSDHRTSPSTTSSLATSPHTVEPNPIGPHRLPRNVVPTHYNLMISLDPDTKAENYSGEVEIILQCHQPTSSIALHAGQHVEMHLVMLSDGINVTSIGRTGKRGETVVLYLDKTLRRGNQYSLTVHFKSILSWHSALGFWVHHGRGGKEHTLYVKFFQPDGARRAFPCFDEPDAKATFNISILHPDFLAARSNMPLLTSTDSGGGMVLDAFNTTPPMSTYLASWVISDFKHKTKDRVTVWATQSVSEEALDKAIDAVYRCLEYCEMFFGTDFPLPKLDVVGLKHFPYDGMEDWGLIIIKEYHLFGPSPTFEIIMHEIVHQWIGDLVTATWWNDIWVQEAPTYYLSFVGAQLVHPHGSEVERALSHAFRGEHGNSYRPALFLENSTMGQQISEDLHGALEFSINSRAHYLLRMIHLLLGDDEFKTAIVALVNKYALRNLNGYEFLQTMTEEQKTEPKVNISYHMRSWFESDGFPGVTFHRNYRNRTITVQQAPYGSTKGHIYHIPIVYDDNRTQDILRPLRYDNIHWITDEREELDDPRDNETAILLNPGMIGYFVVNYDSRNWALIGRHLVENPHMADPFLLTQLFSSAEAFYRRGDTNIDSLLWLWEGMTSITDEFLWNRCLDAIIPVDRYLDGFEDRERYHDRFIEIWNLTATSTLQWNTSNVYRGFENYVRAALCDMDYFKCVEAVLTAWNEQQDQLNSYFDFGNWTQGLFPQERAMLCLIVRHGDRQTWEKIRSWAENPYIEEVNTVVIASLACSKDDDLAMRAMNDSVSHFVHWSYSNLRLRFPRRFRRMFLDVVFAHKWIPRYEPIMVTLASDLVETDEDVLKFEQRAKELQETAGMDLRRVNELITIARTNAARRKRDEPFFKRWLDRQLPDAS